MLYLILIISLTFSLTTYNERKTFKELLNIYLNQLDINDAYLSYEQYIYLLQNLKIDFPDYLELASIGKTYEGNEMPLLIMKSPFNSKKNEDLNLITYDINNSTFYYTNIYKYNNNISNLNKTYIIDNLLYNKSGIFFNGMHHGSEPVSMMMNIYLILYLLSLPKAYLHLFLSSTNIYFIPIINIDAYKYNSQKYFLTDSLKSMKARKNRKPHKTINNCKKYNIGVDLNRNYDYFFGDNNNGSSGSPCHNMYRGEYPFSEPETNNIKNFIETHPDIKISINYHAWGNLILIPFNYLSTNESLKILQNDYPIHYKIYQDFKKEANYPENFQFGNGEKTIKYKSNGDSIDWFLGKKNILSFTQELGNGNKNSEKFYPNKNITFDILEKNLPSALYAIEKSMFYLKSKLLKAEYSICTLNNKYNNQLYFNDRFTLFDNYNIKKLESKNCFLDEIILKVKIKIENYGFGTYIPGIEFNYNQFNNINNSYYESANNKKYFYFLALDLNINIENIRSICYWSHSLNNKNTTNNTIKENNYNNSENNLNIRCLTNKENNLKDVKIFIDNEIKFLESIILHLQIIVKKDDFIEMKKNLKKEKKLGNNTFENETLVKLYTKKERIIKTEKINGEIIEWKFNNPCISIKTEEFIEIKNKNFVVIREEPFKLLCYMIISTFLIIFFIYRTIRIMSLENVQDIENNQVNEIRNLYRNNNNNIQNVNNFENINQFHNNNEQINLFNHFRNNYQIDRDDDESNLDSS